MQRTFKRFCSLLPSLFSCIMGYCLIVILVLLVVGQPAFNQYYKPKSLLSNAALFPFALTAVVALFLFAKNSGGGSLNSKHKKLFWKPFLQLVVLCVQFIIARSCWHKMGWDVSTIYTTAEEFAYGLPPTQLGYFSAYPNNAPLTLLHTIPLWIAYKLGFAVPFVVLPYIDAVLLHLSAFFCSRCIVRLTPNSAARFFGTILSYGWIALSPYILYPYTDTFSILFPVLILYLYLTSMRPVLKWFLISLMSFIGAAIKPTVLIVLIALVILSVCKMLTQKLSTRKILKAVIIAGVILMGMIPGKLFADCTVVWLTGSTNPAEEHGLGYWFLTGMNGETYGGHSAEDVNYANSFTEYSERQNACFTRAWERLSGRTLTENLHFFAVKAYKAYADGSFASHSSFLPLETPKRTDSLSLFLRSLYFKRGTLMPYCQTIVQVLWLMVLSLCAYTAIRLRSHPVVAVLSLTLLGLTAYLLLFEVWPRYLFLYAPFFVILASMAFHRMPKNDRHTPSAH